MSTGSAARQAVTAESPAGSSCQAMCPRVHVSLLPGCLAPMGAVCQDQAESTAGPASLVTAQCQQMEVGDELRVRRGLATTMSFSNRKQQRRLPEIKLLLLSGDTQGKRIFNHQSKTERLWSLQLLTDLSWEVILALNILVREMLSQAPRRTTQHRNARDIPRYPIHNSFHKDALISSRQPLK